MKTICETIVWVALFAGMVACHAIDAYQPISKVIVCAAPPYAGWQASCTTTENYSHEDRSN